MDIYNQGITQDERNLLYGIFKELNQRVDCVPESSNVQQLPQQTLQAEINVTEESAAVPAVRRNLTRRIGARILGFSC